MTARRWYISSTPHNFSNRIRGRPARRGVHSYCNLQIVNVGEVGYFVLGILHKNTLLLNLIFSVDKLSCEWNIPKPMTTLI